MNLVEVSWEEAKHIITSKKVAEGGIPKWMYEESYLSILELLEDVLQPLGLRIAFIKTDPE